MPRTEAERLALQNKADACDKWGGLALGVGLPVTILTAASVLVGGLYAEEAYNTATATAATLFTGCLASLTSGFGFYHQADIYRALANGCRP